MAAVLLEAEAEAEDDPCGPWVPAEHAEDPPRLPVGAQEGARAQEEVEDPPRDRHPWSWIRSSPASSSSLHWGLVESQQHKRRPDLQWP